MKKEIKVESTYDIGSTDGTCELYVTVDGEPLAEIRIYDPLPHEYVKPVIAMFNELINGEPKTKWKQTKEKFDEIDELRRRTDSLLEVMNNSFTNKLFYLENGIITD